MLFILFGKNLINMLITFFHLNAFFPLHLHKTMVEYIYNKNLWELNYEYRSSNV